MAEKLTEFFALLRLAVDRLAVKKTLDDMPPQKRRLVMITAAVILAILMLIFILTKLPNGDKTGVQNAPVPVPLEARPGIIPPEDLFLPDEPDFIPGVMPEREQRETWTADDAAPFWTDPLKNGEQQWRDRIEETIDKIMENVQ
jgi:hypothetical protein